MKNKKGFTLIELLVAMSIFIVLLLLAANFVSRGLQAKRKSSAKIVATEEAQRSLRDITKEIRKSIQSDRGDYNLDLVNEQELSFYSDINDDGSAEKVRYFLDSTNFKKGVIEAINNPPEYIPANETIKIAARYINNQSDAVFSYYDEDNNLIGDPINNKDLIKLIKVNLKFNFDPNDNSGDYEIATAAQIRNLKDNL